MVLYANRKVFVGLKICFLEFSNFLFIEIWGVTDHLLKFSVFGLPNSNKLCFSSC
jgi:hypothetical protein